MTPKRRPSIVFTFLCALGVLSGLSFAAAEKPNIILIITDDLGYADLGVTGAEGYETPALDRLAREGTFFSDFYVAQPVCSASRAAIFSGAYPNRIGIKGGLNVSDVTGIHADETLLPELLQAEGYATVLLGKWHLGHHPIFNPTRHGFGRNNYSVRSERWRFIQYQDGSSEFYDHQNDPHEWHNLIGKPEYRDIVETHRQFIPKKRAEYSGFAPGHDSWLEYLDLE